VQEAANAYEVLSNPTKKADYDRQASSQGFGGGFWDQYTGAGGQQQQQQEQANANQTWSNVSNDADVIEEVGLLEKHLQLMLQLVLKRI